MPLSFSSRRIELSSSFGDKWEVFRKADTDPQYGIDPFQRSVSELLKLGVVNVDKPPHPTSHEVVAHIKKIFGIKKAGHSGTLDPAVTGVLPTALGRGTKILRALLESPKGYVVLMKLHNHDVSEDLFKEKLHEFTTTILQKPPLKSSVRKVLRKRTIYSSELLDFNDNLALFKVYCQAGTYMRKLCTDLGEAIGCGGHMQELRRVKTGPFEEDETLTTLQELMDAVHYWKKEDNELPLRSVVLPIEAVTRAMPHVFILDTTVDAICHGAKLALPGIVKHNVPPDHAGRVAVFTLKSELVCLANLSVKPSKWQEMATEDKAVIDPEAVVMPRETYPRGW